MGERKLYVVIYLNRVMDCDDEIVNVMSEQELANFKLTVKNYPKIHSAKYYEVIGDAVKIETIH